MTLKLKEICAQVLLNQEAIHPVPQFPPQLCAENMTSLLHRNPGKIKVINNYIVVAAPQAESLGECSNIRSYR